MSEEDFWKFLTSKQTHFKFQAITPVELDSEMLNLVSECAQYGGKASIYELFIYKL